MTTPNLPAEWEPNEWLPAANVAGPLGSGLSSLPQWDREAFDDWIKARAKAMIDDALDVFEDAGLPIAAMRAWMDAIVSAIQGDFGPLEDLVGDTILGFVPDFTELKDAMLGEYTGSDPVLLAISNLFALLRKVLELVGGVASGNLPTIQQLVDGFGDLAAAVGGLIEGLFKIPLWQLDSGGVEVIDRFDGLSTVEEVEGWSWDETDGHDGLGCALFTATGTPGVLLSPTPVEVREGEQYTVSAWAKATGTSGGGIALGVQWFDTEHVAVSSSTAQTVGSPSSSWAELSGTVTVPAGARYSRRMLKVDATAGEVRWDDVRFTGEATTIPQQWVDGLADALQGVIDWVGALVDELLGALGIPAIGDLFDRISDLADEVSGWFDDTQDRAAELGDLISDLLADPASVIGTLPQTLISNASGWVTSALGGKASTAAVAAVEGFLLDLANAILSAIRGVPVVGGVIADRIEDVLEDIGVLKDTAETAQSTAAAVQVGIVEGWVNGDDTNADQAVFDTFGAIRALVGGDGYTRVNITSSQLWNIPVGVTEVIVVGVSAGQNGEGGGTSANGGNGGQGGGHKVQALDLTGLTAIYIEVGPPGQPLRFRANSSGGAILMETFPGAPGAMATQFGYTGSTSQAGGGGGGGGGKRNGDTPGGGGNGAGGGLNGATGQGGSGGSGGASAAANGGGGASAAGAVGGSGGSLPVGAPVPCGGAGGGGGGGGIYGSFGPADGGDGGPGGFPGGGGGGGGGAGLLFASGNRGAGGAGGAALGIIYYR